MNNLKFYREKKNEVHTAEEILSAFENSVVFCFELIKDREVSAKSQLLGGISKINPEVIITEADLCIMNTEPAAHRKQILVIDKNGNIDTEKGIFDLMYKSGVVPCCYVSYKEKKNCVKRCILHKFDNKTTVVKKMNLLVDYGNLLVTVRHLSTADHEKKESSEE